MTQENDLRGLKMIVMSLGIALVGGVVVLIALILGKAGGSGAAEETIESCMENKVITLKNMGEVEHFEQVGGFLRIGMHNDETGKFSVVTIDPCTNEVKSRVAIMTQ